MAELGDLSAFVAVARAGGFRQAARAVLLSASHSSEAVRRLEAEQAPDAGAAQGFCRFHQGVSEEGAACGGFPP